MRIAYLILLCLLGMLLPGQQARAAESFDTCTNVITTSNTSINAPGNYCMKSDVLSSNNNALDISANDVIIDCNGFRLIYSGAAGTSTGAGIYTNYGSHVTVRHCIIEGFQKGIDLESNTLYGHVVEDNRIDGSTGLGIEVFGNDALVRRNIVSNTGTATAGSAAIGIEMLSAGGSVRDNTIIGLRGSGAATGIYVYNGQGLDLTGNHLGGITTSSTGTAYGIRLSDVSNAAIRENDITGHTGGTSHALSCEGDGSPEGVTIAHARANVMTGFTDATLGGCLDGGGNDLTH